MVIGYRLWVMEVKVQSSTKIKVQHDNATPKKLIFYSLTRLINSLGVITKIPKF